MDYCNLPLSNTIDQHCNFHSKLRSKSRHLSIDHAPNVVQWRCTHWLNFYCVNKVKTWQGHMHCSDVEKCQTEGFDWQNFIRTDKKIIFLLHILLFGLSRFSKSVQMTGISKKISTSLALIKWQPTTEMLLPSAKYCAEIDTNVQYVNVNEASGMKIALEICLNYPTSDRVFSCISSEFTMLPFPSCLYLPSTSGKTVSLEWTPCDVINHTIYSDVMINPSLHRFLTRICFEADFESKEWCFGTGFGRRKSINHNFVQGQRNPPSCQRFATSTTQQASLWTANIWHTVGFPCPCAKLW